MTNKTKNIFKKICALWILYLREKPAKLPVYRAILTIISLILAILALVFVYSLL
jgi:uncharacterized membrane protein